MRQARLKEISDSIFKEQTAKINILAARAREGGCGEDRRVPMLENSMILETYTRVFVDAEALDRSVCFYKSLLSGEQTLRFVYPEAGLELAAVSSPRLSVLIIAGPAEKRAPFEATRLTVKVDRLEPFLDVLKQAGAEQLEPIQATPVGRKTRFRHSDGLVVEYVDHAAPGNSGNLRTLVCGFVRDFT
jgi:hypothetical protein